MILSQDSCVEDFQFAFLLKRKMQLHVFEKPGEWLSSRSLLLFS